MTQSTLEAPEASLAHRPLTPILVIKCSSSSCSRAGHSSLPLDPGERIQQERPSSATGYIYIPFNYVSCLIVPFFTSSLLTTEGASPVITVMKYFYELLKGEPKLGHNGETGGQGAGITVGFTVTNCSPKVLLCEGPVPTDQWAPLLAVAVDTRIIHQNNRCAGAMACRLTLSLA